MGGSPNPPAPASPPPAGQVTREQLQAELEYRPRFRQEDVSDIQAFAEASRRAFETEGVSVARSQQALAEELQPEVFAGQRAVADEVIRRLSSGISPDMESAYRRRFAGEEARAGRLGSEVGSASIARQLAELDEASRQAGLNAGLSFIGRNPVAQASTSVPIQRGTEFGGLVAPGLSYTASNYGTAGNIYGSQLGYAAARNQSRADIIGAGIGAAGQIGAAFAGR